MVSAGQAWLAAGGIVAVLALWFLGLVLGEMHRTGYGVAGRITLFGRTLEFGSVKALDRDEGASE